MRATRLPAIAALVALLLLLAAIWAPSARADSEAIRHFDIAYDVQPDGTIDVRLEIDWFFGETGRHGIEHDIVIQEPWDDDASLDAVQRITDLDVHSPSGAPAQFTTSEVRVGNEKVLRVRIGDPDRTLTTDQASYVLEYTVEGGMRTFDGVPELFLDAISDGSVFVERFTAEVWAPEGVDKSRCLIGDDECPSIINGGYASYSAIGVGEAISVAAILPPGSVSNAEPILVDADRGPGILARILVGLGTALVAAAAMFAISRIGNKHDDRYVNVPPGLSDRGGAVKAVKRFEVPVQFNPPDIPVHDAGVLLKRRYAPDQLAATLISLAVRGAVKVGSDPLAVHTTDPAAARSETEAKLVGLATQQGPLPDKNARGMGEAMEAAAKRTLNSTGWFKQGSARPNLGLFLYLLPWALWIGGLAVVIIFGDTIGPYALPILLGLALAVSVAWLFTRGANDGPVLTAEGTAMLDQIEGFRTYIATAEAERLDVEAEQDIFSRYLPWAVLFGLTERWVQVCRRLAAAGRIAPVDTSFWEGNRSFDSGISRFGSDVSTKSANPSRSGSRSSRGSRGGGGSGGSRSRSW